MGHRAVPSRRRTLVLDPGTTTVRVAEHGRGVLAREPSVVAVEQRSGAVLAMGALAAPAAQARPGDVLVERPVQGGAVLDVPRSARFLALLLQRVGVSRATRLRLVVCVPITLTAVERRGIAEAARLAGAASVELVDAPLVAAVGAGLAVDEPAANVVLDVGGGGTQAAVVSLGGIVTSAGARVGGADVDEALRAHVRVHHGVALGDRAVEQLKAALAAAVPRVEQVLADAVGRDLRSGAAVTVRLDGTEVREAIDGVLTATVDVLRRLFATCPPELLRDVPSTGVHLLGGGALLRGLEARIAEEVQVPVTPVADPLDAVVRGAATLTSARRGATRRVWS